jgi:hypothetical protein
MKELEKEEINEISKELEITELEDRLEMVNLASANADRCENNACSTESTI